ncbi:MAG: restriction endonuclease subunit S [Verrucomicrobia bacterium]|nr:restriction endonuclease subunit S [Verrucomicrobiota bacterium]
MSELPKGWVKTTGESMFRIVRGVTYNKTQAKSSPFEKSVTVLRAGNLQDGELLFDDLVYVPENNASLDQRLTAGDMVIAMSSGSKSVVGKVASVREDYPKVSFGAFCGLIRPRTKDIAPWLRAFFQTREYRRLISEMSTGVNINNLKPSFLSELSLLLPPLPEQRRIVAKLEACEARIGAARDALADVPKLLEQYRQSVLAAAFRGDLTRDWRAKHPDIKPAATLVQKLRAERRQRWEQSELAKYKAKGKKTPQGWEEKYQEPQSISESALAELPQLPSGWCWVTFDSILSVSSGIQLKANGMAPNGTIPVFGGNGITGHHDRSNVPPNTIVIGRVGYYCGSIHETPGAAWVTDNALIVSYSRNTIDQRFMFWLLKSSDLGNLSNSSAQPVVSGGKIYAAVVPIPPLLEQRELARILDVISAFTERMVTTHIETAADLTTLTQSLLAKAFRGELVPQDPADEAAAGLLTRLQSHDDTVSKSKRRKIAK